MLSLFLGTFVGAPAAEAPARGVLLSRVGPPEPQFLLRREGHSSALVPHFAAAGREAAAPPATSYILLHAAPHDPVMTSSRRDSSEPPFLARQQLIVERQLVNHVAVPVHQTSSRLGGVPVSQLGVPVHQTARLGGPVLHHSGMAASLVRMEFSLMMTSLSLKKVLKVSFLDLLLYVYIISAWCCPNPDALTADSPSLQPSKSVQDPYVLIQLSGIISHLFLSTI
jgi:hypothetical protein